MLAIPLTDRKTRFFVSILKKMFCFHLSFVWKSRFKNSSDILRCKRLWCNCIVAVTLTTNWILCQRIRKVPIRKVDRFMYHIDIYSFIHDNWFYLRWLVAATDLTWILYVHIWIMYVQYTDKVCILLYVHMYMKAWCTYVLFSAIGQWL